MRKTFIALTLAAIATAASAQVTVPNTFVAGAPAKAADVNANFQALATAINSLNTRVGKLEGGPVTSSDLVGSYTINAIQTELGGAGINPGKFVSTYVAKGTISFSADGTGKIKGYVETGHEVPLHDAAGPRTIHSVSVPELNFSWSYVNGVLSAKDSNGNVMINGSATVALGGKLIIMTSSNPNDGTSVLQVWTRSN
ncbi:hypothetical protein [Paucibacter sp. KCTC 42545]|uniref:hypothetical protein n=1 Tax=Paucibacter sp. KCTC 42545 TaxID=1768242 RepID=UPI000733BF68|nr:hypothetical protein [Paucibacter sp. KCTC 42545]ALT77992.1 hypothetical protein AT984_13185 [Paucibacter sp. KCTC 42545]